MTQLSEPACSQRTGIEKVRGCHQVQGHTGQCCFWPREPDKTSSCRRGTSNLPSYCISSPLANEHERGKQSSSYLLSRRREEAENSQHSQSQTSSLPCKVIFWSHRYQSERGPSQIGYRPSRPAPIRPQTAAGWHLRLGSLGCQPGAALRGHGFHCQSLIHPAQGHGRLQAMEGRMLLILNNKRFCLGEQHLGKRHPLHPPHISFLSATGYLKK